MRRCELTRLLTHLIELENDLSKRNIRAGRQAFYEAVSIVGKAIDGELASWDRYLDVIERDLGRWFPEGGSID